MVWIRSGRAVLFHNPSVYCKTTPARGSQTIRPLYGLTQRNSHDTC